MQNVIRFPGSASRAGHAVAGIVAPAAGSIGNVVDALSRTLDQIRMLLELLPDGPAREQLKAEQNRLMSGLSVARQSARQLTAIAVPATASNAAS